ncbi:TRAP transporter small permease [Aestuariibius sp. 2305UL40-4]|uniref:TRAP transporter small permease n=1 Tax=Aestuariibius violaceus TaxID=3234132 RepID=UPI00345ED6CA
MQIAPAAQARTERALEPLARWLAYLGGVILVAVAIMVVASIIGRRLIFAGLGPIPGDYELVEAGVGIAVFYFLPWCQLRRGHVTVDILVDTLPKRGKALFGFLGDSLIALAAGVIFWRFYLGFGEKFPYFSEAWRDRLAMGYKPFFPETSYELEIPIWIIYGLALIGAAVFFVVSLYAVWRSLNWLLAGEEGRTTPEESPI